MKSIAVATFLAIFGLALTAPSYHHDKHHESTYVVVTKHDSHPQHGWEEKNIWSPHHIDEYKSHDDYDHGDWHKHDVHDTHPKYEFDYGVKDLKTGDIKNQWEHRDGDHVKGSYSLKESDGTTRIVEYSADDHNGFNAVVKKIGHAEHPVVYSKPIHHSGWEDHSGYKGHGGDDYHYDHSHGSHGDHATSYIKVEQH